MQRSVKDAVSLLALSLRFGLSLQNAALICKRTADLVGVMLDLQGNRLNLNILCYVWASVRIGNLISDKKIRMADSISHSLNLLLKLLGFPNCENTVEIGRRPYTYRHKGCIPNDS